MARAEAVWEEPLAAPESARRLAVMVDPGRCAGCQECVVRCPTGALTLDPEGWMATAQEDLCVGCRQCQRTCPFGAIEVEGPPRVAPRVRLAPHRVESLAFSRAETRPGLASWEEAEREAARCLTCPDPTCVAGCPAHNDIPGFIAALRDRDLAKAHAILRETSVLPDICSRVCDQASQCEGACSWALAGARPVAIGLLERFIADHAPVPPPAPVRQPANLPSVAVVGSGPAGLAAAWDLLEAGVEVHLYERLPEPLGVLGWGIPPFTLPEAVARRPLEALLQAGLNLHTGVAVGQDVPLAELSRRHGAVLLAYGASEPLRLRVPGADLRWVEDATSFLRRGREALAQARHLPDVYPGIRLLVVGAGNTAMDVARIARRLGATALAVDWMDRRFARVRADELAEAEAEGVEVRFSTSVTRFEEDPAGGRLAYLAPTRQPRAEVLPRVVGPGEPLTVDRVVVAMGYRVDPALAQAAGASLPVGPQGLVPAIPDRTLLATGLPAGNPALARQVQERDAYVRRAAQPIAPGVWAVGDALSGPATVVAAMAHGRAAARQILAALSGSPTRAGQDEEAEEPEGDLLRWLGAQVARRRRAGAASSVAGRSRR